MGINSTTMTVRCKTSTSGYKKWKKECWDAAPKPTVVVQRWCKKVVPQIKTDCRDTYASQLTAFVHSLLLILLQQFSTDCFYTQITPVTPMWLKCRVESEGSWVASASQAGIKIKHSLTANKMWKLQYANCSVQLFKSSRSWKSKTGNLIFV